MQISRNIKLAGIIVIMIGSILFGLYSVDNSYAYQETELGTIGVFTRTGGRLQNPSDTQYVYPLGGNYTSPGNTSFDDIHNVQHFSIFHQVGFGRSLFEGTVDNPHYDIYGSTYETTINLTSWIEVSNGSLSERYSLNTLRNLIINESTAQIFTLTKDIDLVTSESYSDLSIDYLYTTGQGPITQDYGFNNTIVSFNVLFQNEVNISIISEWSLIFYTRTISTIRFNGSLIVGSFLLQKDIPDDVFTLSGRFACIFEREYASVLGLRLPYIEVTLLVAGSFLLVFSHAQKKIKKS